MPGTLYIIATPIGNLEDITLRALRLLKEVDVIACEDTRQTQKLLNHFGIQTRTISYHKHNEFARTEQILELLAAGKSVAVVSDAGTPGISDPGQVVVQAALKAGANVIPIPGAVAFVNALVASGLPTESFRFAGFLSAKSGQRKTLLESIRNSAEPVIFYEAPHRILEAVEDVVQVMGGNRLLVIARELTKLHEEVLRGTAQQLLQQLQARESLRGEMVMIIGPAEATGVTQDETQASLAQQLEQIMREQGLDEKSAMKVLARQLAIGKSELYRELQRQRVPKVKKK